MKRNKSNMTSMMPKMAIVLVAIVFIFSLFKIGTTKASSDVVEVTNVEISAKSDTTDVDTVKFEDGKIKNNVTFHKVGDYLTYNVTITNKEDKNYTLKTITDNNGNESLTYSYSGYEGAKLEANKAATFKVTITYAKELEDINKRNQSNLVALTLTFEDEEGNEQEEEVIVDPTDDNKEEQQEETTPEESKEKDETPQTGDNIGVYITTTVASFVLLVVLSRKQFVTNKKSNKTSKVKHGKKILSLILAIALLVPTFSNISKAATSTLSTSLDTTIKFMDKLVVSYVVGNETKEQVIPYNGTIADLEEPTQDGFNFTGWATENGTEVTEDTKITEDITLVPVFEELAKTSEITITVEDEQTRDFTKNVTISAVNTNISDDKVKLQYSFDDGQTWIDYAEAITVAENGTIKARTIIIASEAVIGTAEKEISTIMSTATFKSGPEVNQKMMELAGVEGLIWEEKDLYLYASSILLGGYWQAGQGDIPYVNESIIAIKQANSEQYQIVKNTLTDINIVSTTSSKKPIYMWYDNGIIYYYSEAEKIFLNEDASYMFAYFLNLSELDLINIDTTKTKNMQFLIIFNQGLQEIDLSNFNTSNITNMKGMFLYCFGCQKINMSSFDTKNVTDMSYMFELCVQLTELDVSGFDTSKVVNMTEMFAICGVKELDLSGFDTRNVTSMFFMFGMDSELVELNVSNFDTSNVTDMRYMFGGLRVTELDISSFDTSKVKNMEGMFIECRNLTTIYASNKFITDSVEDNGEEMFNMYGSDCLIGGNGTVHNSEHENKEYARIDTPETPGYFTDIADKP